MHPVETFELVLVLLAISIALYWAASRIGLPPSAALLIGGGALAFIPGIPDISLDPQLALVLFLPPLLMDGAYYTAFGRFRRHLPGILSLAVGAVLFTTLGVGVVLKGFVPTLRIRSTSRVVTANSRDCIPRGYGTRWTRSLVEASRALA